MPNLDERYDFACKVIREAGALALDYFNRFETLDVQSKGVQDMASEADLETQKLLETALMTAFPDDLFFGEEDPDSFMPDASKGTWIIDPIDGTQPFVNGIPSWCISIAYVEGTDIKIGIVYDPVHDELFAAQASRGATLNGRNIGVSGATGLEEGLVCVGFSNRVTPDQVLIPLTRLANRNGMYHRNGSGALSLAYVAAGRLIGYFEPHMNTWDFAASALIIEEAGGRVNDCLPDEKTLVEGGLVLAGAPGVFDALSDVVFGSD